MMTTIKVSYGVILINSLSVVKLEDTHKHTHTYTHIVAKVTYWLADLQNKAVPAETRDGSINIMVMPNVAQG